MAFARLAPSNQKRCATLHAQSGDASRDEAKERALLKALRETPRWLERDLTRKERELVIDKLSVFVREPEDVVERVSMKYWKGMKKLADEGTLIVLHRLYFAVPESATREEAGSKNPYFGGTHPDYPKVAVRKDSALWPLAKDGERLVLAGQWAERGPLPFFFKEEFASFRKYGRRSKETRSCGFELGHVLGFDQ